MILVDAVLPFHPDPLHIEDTKEQGEEQVCGLSPSSINAIAHPCFGIDLRQILLVRVSVINHFFPAGICDSSSKQC